MFSYQATEGMMPPTPAHDGDRAESHRFELSPPALKLGGRAIYRNKKLLSSSTGKSGSRFLPRRRGGRDRSTDDGSIAPLVARPSRISSPVAILIVVGDWSRECLTLVATPLSRARGWRENRRGW